MGSFLSLISGVGIGLVTSLIAWLVTMLALSPRVKISGIATTQATHSKNVYEVQIASRRKWRSLADMQVACDLRIPHGAGEENVLQLQIPSGSFPIVPPDWARAIVVSMDTDKLTSFGQDQLGRRLAELKTPKSLENISSLLDVFDLLPGSHIMVTVLASDRISGTRNVTLKSLRPLNSAEHPAIGTKRPFPDSLPDTRTMASP